MRRPIIAISLFDVFRYSLHFLANAPHALVRR